MTCAAILPRSRNWQSGSPNSRAELLGVRRVGRSKNIENETGCLAKYNFNDIIGSHESIVKLKVLGQRVAGTSSPVLVLGETGVGKELLVQSIHNSSPRKNKPFVAQNCAAFPPTLLESILFGTVKGSFTGAEDRPGLFELGGWRHIVSGRNEFHANGTAEQAASCIAGRNHTAGCRKFAAAGVIPA